MELAAITRTTTQSTPNLAIVSGILGGCALVAIVLFVLFRVVSNKHVASNRKKYFDLNKKICSSLKSKSDLVISFYPFYQNHLVGLGLNKTIRCSRSVVSGSIQNPLKYVMKYSNIDYSIESLEAIDVMSKFFAKYDSFLSEIKKTGEQIKKSLPLFYRMFVSEKKLPYLVCDFDQKVSSIELPFVNFVYISPAGKSGSANKVILDASMLESIVSEISESLNKKGHSKMQRNIMTNDLREAIKKRDNYTCCICGNSVLKEPNLLLEVDHIIPVSKGGKTESSNLQTLCWRCNRIKSNKM